MVLPPVIERAAAVEADRGGTGIARLRDVIFWVGGKQLAQFLFVHRGRSRAVHDLFTVKGTDIELVEVLEHVVALVHITEPPRAQGGKFFRFAEIKPDDAGAEREDGPVVGQARADGIGHDHMAAAHALDQTGDTEERIAAENQGVEPRVGHARVEHVDFLQTGNTFQVKPVVEDEEVAALNQGDSHATREKAVLGVGGISRTRREQSDHRIRDSRGRQSAESFEDQDRHIRDALRIVVLEHLAENAGKRAAVLHHVGNPRSIAEVMVRDRHASVGQSREGEAGQMEKGPAGQRQTDGRALEIRTAEDRLRRDDTAAQNFLGTVDVLQKQLESAQALLQTRGNLRPLGVSEKLRQHIAKPRALAPRRATARDVEVHTHLAHGRFEALDDRADFTARHGHHAVEQRAVNFPRGAVRAEHLVPERTLAGFCFHRRDGFHRARQGQGDTDRAFCATRAPRGLLRRRNQLFQVLRMVWRVLRYCCSSSDPFFNAASAPATEKSSVSRMVQATPTAAAWWASLPAVMGKPRFSAY